MFLKCYMCDWPVKEYLKRHFANWQAYRKRVQKGIDKAIEDMWDFGSENHDNDEQ